LHAAIVLEPRSTKRHKTRRVPPPGTNTVARLAINADFEQASPTPISSALPSDRPAAVDEVPAVLGGGRGSSAWRTFSSGAAPVGSARSPERR
jgi:hypothetical protein